MSEPEIVFGFGEDARAAKGKATKNDAMMFDVDGDGVLSGEELEILQSKLHEDRKMQRYTRRMLGFALVALVLSAAAQFGLTTYAIEAGKEVETSNDDEGHAYLTGMDNETPLRVDRSSDRRSLSSLLPDETFAKLEQMQVAGPTGTVSFNVLGWARYDEPESMYGSVVVLYSLLGTMEMDGGDMAFEENMAGSFSRAGLVTERFWRRDAGNSHRHRLRRTSTFQAVVGVFSFLTGLEMADKHSKLGTNSPLVAQGVVENPFIEAEDKSWVYVEQIEYVSCEYLNCTNVPIGKLVTLPTPAAAYEHLKFFSDWEPTQFLERRHRLLARKWQGGNNEERWYSVTESYFGEYREAINVVKEVAEVDGDGQFSKRHAIAGYTQVVEQKPISPPRTGNWVTKYKRKYFCTNLTETREMILPTIATNDGDDKTDVVSVISYVGEGGFLNGRNTKMYYIHDENVDPVEALTDDDPDTIAVPYFERVEKEKLTKDERKRAGPRKSEFYSFVTNDFSITVTEAAVALNGVDIGKTGIANDLALTMKGLDNGAIAFIKHNAPSFTNNEDTSQDEYTTNFVWDGFAPAESARGSLWKGLDGACTSFGQPQSVDEGLTDPVLANVNAPPVMHMARSSPIEVNLYYEDKDGTPKAKDNTTGKIRVRPHPPDRSAPHGRVRDAVNQLAAADPKIAAVLPPDWHDVAPARRRRFDPYTYDDSFGAGSWDDVNPDNYAGCDAGFEFDFDDAGSFSYNSCDDLVWGCGQTMFNTDVSAQMNGGKLWGVCTPYAYGSLNFQWGAQPTKPPCDGLAVAGCVGIGMTCGFGFNKKGFKLGVECTADLSLCGQTHPYPALSGGLDLSCEAGGKGGALRVKGKVKAEIIKIGISSKKRMKPTFKVQIYGGGHIKVGWIKIEFGGWATIVHETINQCLPFGDRQGNDHLDGCGGGSAQQQQLPCVDGYSEWTDCVTSADATCDGGIMAGTRSRHRTVYQAGDFGGDDCPVEALMEACNSECTTTTTTTTTTITTTTTTTTTTTITTTTTTTTTPEPVDCEEHWGAWSLCRLVEGAKHEDNKRLCVYERDMLIDSASQYGGQPCSAMIGAITTQRLYSSKMDPHRPARGADQV